MMDSKSASLSSKASINDINLPLYETPVSQQKHLKLKKGNSKTSEWAINYAGDAGGNKYTLEKLQERKPTGPKASGATCLPAIDITCSPELLKGSQSEKMFTKENTGGAFEAVLSSDSSKYLSQEETADFITKNVNQKECKLFVPKDDKCQCGRTQEHHADGVPRADSTVSKWMPNEHTKTLPCCCFGQIQFRGFGGSMTTPLYARIDTDSQCDVLWELMINHWKMPTPRLLISVTGGAQKFELKPRLSTILKKGLIETALNTGAWIITGGTKSGVMEFVGEAVKDHMTIKGSTGDDDCIALGIATWGIVGNREYLDSAEEGRGVWPADYEAEKLAPKATALDPNHTHFLLVDDGSEGNFGREIPFRSRLEKFISEKNPEESQDVKIPVVLIVVEGGIGTIDTVKESLSNGTPVVLIKGSGRAADYLAKCYQAALKDDQETKFGTEAEIKDFFNLKNDDQAKKCVQSIKDCFKKEQMKYLNVFDLEKSTSFKDIDREILYALLRANKSDCKSQLALALAWHRCDVAQEQIFTSENRSSWKAKDLNDAMFTALVQDQSDFVQLILDNGVDIRRFLTVETLWNLYYNSIYLKTMEASIMKDLVKVKKSNWLSSIFCCWSLQPKGYPDLLFKVNEAIADLLQDQSFTFYKGDKFKVEHLRVEKPKMEWLPSARSNSVEKEAKKTPETFDFEYPARELFIYAVLLNRQDLAKLFLKLGTDQMGVSLLGSSLLKELSKKAADYEETALSEDLLNHSRSLEIFAKATLNECYSRSKLDAHTLLYREMKQLGNISILSLVDRQDLMDFAEHPACQTKLTSLWKGDLAPKTSAKKILLTSIFPLLIFTIKFRDVKKDLSKGPNKIGHSDCVPYSSRQDKTVLKYIETKPGFTQNKMNIFKAIHKFYSAPVIKFTNNIIAYLVLLGLFSFFLLTEFSPAGVLDSPSVIEYIVWAWFATLILEEVRQVLVIHQSSLFYKLSIWWNNTWNRFDLLMYILMILSIILRYLLSGHDFVYARIVYSITLVMCYMRFMQFYFAEQNMGPKVIMIRRMLTDLAFFFFILIVFILAFGVAYHINMFPNQPKDWSILYTVLLYPYFQMYGELFLDELKGKSDGDSCTTNQSVWELDLSQRCPETNAIVYIFLSVYLVMINILLINLLIAMFSYTFQKVQDNSTQVWRFHRISLVYEYFDRPSLVPPLIIINHLWRILCYCCPCLGKHATFGVELSNDANTRLTKFEKAAVETYLAQAATKEKDLLENQVASAVSKLETVLNELNTLKEIVSSKDNQDKPKKT